MLDMKRRIKKTLLALSLTLGVSGLAWSEEADSLGVIGDNLDLHAVLDAFKNAQSVEEFEKKINEKDSKINNIDLDEDDEVDYIQVIDNTEGDAHALVLRVDVSETESQDIAVIELEKTGDENATIQIVGDEDIYGDDYIIEPTETVTSGNMPPAFIVVNVWRWPSVRFIYGPAYRPWRSPWRWRHYPAWWKPWRPYRWRTYHGFHVHHRNHYHVVRVRRCGNAHRVYRGHRRSWKQVKHHKHHHHNHGQKKVKKNKQTKGNKNGGQKQVKTNKKTPNGQKQTKTQVRSNGNKTQKRQKTRSRRR